MTRKEQIAFCLIILLAATLRFAGICFDSLWLDESYQSLVGACGHGPTNLQAPRNERYLFRFEKPAPVAEMLSNFRSVDPLCPPLYALMLNGWMRLFGDSDFALRSMSALISLCSLACLILFCNSVLGTRAALLAGLLNAVSAYDIHYAQEVRMYSLVELSAVISGGSLLCILKTGLLQRRQLLLLPLYAVSTAALVNSHYTALFLAATQGFCCLLFLAWKRNWRLLSLLASAWVLSALCCLPWLGMFLQSASLRKASFYVARTPDLIWPFKALLRIPVNWLSFLSGQRVTAFACGLYASSSIMLTCAAFFSWRKFPESKIWINALFLWCLLPAGGIWLIDLLENHKVVEISRYLIFTAPPIYMLAGWGISALLQSKKKPGIALILLHLLSCAINLVYTHTVTQREPWQEMARKVEELVPVDQPLLVAQFYDIACLDRYLSHPRLQTGVSPSMGQEAIHKILEGKASFALLSAQEADTIKDLVPSQYRLKSQIDLAHGLHLRIYER